MMGRNKEVVPIRTQDLVTCMTCPICDMIMKDATTINECLHTFCRKCIQDMITIEGMDHCPECNEYLGCTPLEKLRSDHSIQGFNDTIMRDIEGAEKKPRSSELLPAPRKEKSLSSFATSPKAKEPSQVAATSTGKKKSAANKVDGTALSIEEPIQKADDSYPRNSSPPVTVAKIKNKKVNSNAGETSKQQMPRKCGKDRPLEPLEGMTDLLKPLVKILAEGVGMTKNSGKAPVEGPVAKSAPPKFHEAKGKGKGKAKAINKAKSKGAVSQSSDVHIGEGSSKAKKIRGGRKKKDAAPEGSNVVAPQAVVDAVNSPSCGRVNPIWLTLLASDAREGYATLPPIPSPYLKIKNSDLPVSFVQKYLVKKLDLNSEADQVEITLHGQPVPPTLTLQNLVELWLQTVPKSGKIKTTVGSSAKDYIMVLRYALKVQQYS